MLIRAIALSIALLVGVGAIIPLATETTQAKKHRKYKHRHYKKYSKAWWRQYHARMRKHRAFAARRRSLRLQQLRLAKAAEANKAAATTTDKKVIVKTSATEMALLPSGDEAPRGWKKGSSTSGEIQFRVDDPSGAQVGTASLTVVGPAMGENNDVGRNKMLSGVPTTSLRREVINRMVSENGWVVNDYQKDVNGKKVYVVVAQSQNGGRVSQRMFYFTEVDGRIYSLATSSNLDSADRISEESEKVLNSLQNGKRNMQRAGLKSEE
jgi:hypothetical protein